MFYYYLFLPSAKQGGAAISVSLLSSVYNFCQVKSQKQNCEILLPSSGQKERHGHRGFNLTALRVYRISSRDH